MALRAGFFSFVALHGVGRFVDNRNTWLMEGLRVSFSFTRVIIDATRFRRHGLNLCTVLEIDTFSLTSTKIDVSDV